MTFVTWQEAQKNGLAICLMKNRAGNVVEPSVARIQNTMNSFGSSGELFCSLSLRVAATTFLLLLMNSMFFFSSR